MLASFLARAFLPSYLWVVQYLSCGSKEFVRAPLFPRPETMIHIGKLIEAELRRQERSVAWFARSLPCERTNVYDIFKRRSIDTEMLLRISIVLRHDFFRYYTAETTGRQENSTHP